MLLNQLSTRRNPHRLGFTNFIHISQGVYSSEGISDYDSLSDHRSSYEWPNDDELTGGTRDSVHQRLQDSHVT